MLTRNESAKWPPTWLSALPDADDVKIRVRWADGGLTNLYRPREMSQLDFRQIDAIDIIAGKDTRLEPVI